MQVKILFLASNKLHFPKEARKSIPYLYSRVDIIWASKYTTLHTHAHKTINSMAPKSDPQVVQNKTYLANHYILPLFNPPLLELGVHTRTILLLV